jgi:hypothetical protein
MEAVQQPLSASGKGEREIMRRDCDRLGEEGGPKITSNNKRGKADWLRLWFGLKVSQRMK